LIVIAIAIARDLRVDTAEFHCPIYSYFVPVPSSKPLKESTAVVGTSFPLSHLDLFHHHQLFVSLPCMDHIQHCGFYYRRIDDWVTRLRLLSIASFLQNQPLARLRLASSVLAKLTTAQLLLFLPAIN
jgi:hypothetical protein